MIRLSPGGKEHCSWKMGMSGEEGEGSFPEEGTPEEVGVKQVKGCVEGW